MSLRSNLPGYRWFHVFRNAAVRTGVYTGVCLTLIFVTWLVIANHVPFLERFAMERNIAASAVLTLLAAVPVLRFRRMPGNLLASGLIAWFFFSLWYRALCFFYHNLGDPPHSTLHVFMMGSVVYLILTTLSWIGTIVRRARAAHSSQANRPTS